MYDGIHKVLQIPTVLFPHLSGFNSPPNKGGEFL